MPVFGIDAHGSCGGLARRPLQQLDGDVVGRLDESHVAVTRRAVDGDARIHQLLAGGIDVVDLVGEMPEIPAAGIDLGIPVIGQLEKRRFGLRGRISIPGCCQEHESVASLLVVDAPDFHEAEFRHVEVERIVEIRDANHGVQVSSSSFLSSDEFADRKVMAHF